MSLRSTSRPRMRSGKKRRSAISVLRLRVGIEAKGVGEVRRAPTDANRLTIAAEDTELEYGGG